MKRCTIQTYIFKIVTLIVPKIVQFDSKCKLSSVKMFLAILKVVVQAQSPHKYSPDCKCGLITHHRLPSYWCECESSVSSVCRVRLRSRSQTSVATALARLYRSIKLQFIHLFIQLSNSVIRLLSN